jgi:hypothetical protein
VRAGVDLFATRALATGRQSFKRLALGWIETQQRLRQPRGKQPFANPRRTAEQVRVGQAPASDGARELRRDCIMSLDT